MSKLRKIGVVETAEKKEKKIKTTAVKNLFIFYFLTQQGTFDWLTFRLMLRSKFIFLI